MARVERDRRIAGRSYGPCTLVYGVIPGSIPLVHELPLFVDVAKPMSFAPPSKKTATWATATIVEPAEYVSGSTTVLCWPPVVNGSTRIWAAAFAEAGTDATSAARIVRASTSRRRLLGGEGVVFMSHSSR